MTNKVNGNYPTQIPNFTFLPLPFILFNISGRVNTSSQVHINPEMYSSIPQSSVWFGEIASWFRQFTPWFRQPTLQFWFCLYILKRILLHAQHISPIKKRLFHGDFVILQPIV